MKVTGATVFCGKAYKVQITVEFLRRLPAIVINGLPANLVRETAECVRHAIISSTGLEFPRQRVVIDIQSEYPVRSGIDLAIALAILGEMNVLPHGWKEKLESGKYIPYGGLSLTGNILPIPGSLEVQALGIMLGSPAMMNGGRHLIGHSLGRMLQEEHPYHPMPPALFPMSQYPMVGWGIKQDWTEIIQKLLADPRPCLLVGPSRNDLVAVACRVAQFMSPMKPEEAWEVARLHEACGLLQTPSITRPFRAPHHSVSLAGMVGSTRPGEYALAHKGVLYLEEVASIQLHTLEAIGFYTKGEPYTQWVGTTQKVTNNWHPEKIICGHVPSESELHREADEERLKRSMGKLCGGNYLRIEL